MRENDIHSITVETSDEECKDSDELDVDLNSCFLFVKRKILNIKFLLKTVSWLCLFIYFIHIEFGMVFVIVSSMYLMYYSMKNKHRSVGEPSAYSVFNTNQERIHGTFMVEPQHLYAYTHSVLHL